MKKPDHKMKKKADWLLSLFGTKDLRYLPDKVLEAVLDGKTEIYDEYLKEYPDLSKDTLQDFFETYFSDRTFLSQDFTPFDVAMLIAQLCGDSDEVLDECAGIGGLIIAKWNSNHDINVYAREISNGTIPFLLFNLAIRNMQGIVVHGDTLSLETFNAYLLSKGEKYSTVTEIDLMEEVRKIDPIRILKPLYLNKRLEGQ